jgi:hypothetical protein
MLDEIIFPKKVSTQLDKGVDIYFHAMSILLEYTDLHKSSLMNVMYNTRYYLKYDVIDDVSELATVDSYQLLSYGLGLYYEEFSFRNMTNFRNYLFRNLKMRISIPLVKIDPNVIGVKSSENEKIFVLCVGYNNENDEIIIIHPSLNEYYNLSLVELELNQEEYHFILLNFPGMMKPKVIKNYVKRITYYYNRVLNRRNEHSRWLVGVDAIQHMKTNKMTNDDLLTQLRVIESLRDEVHLHG